MFIRSIISQSLFISSGCNFAEKFRTKRDAVFCDGPTSIYLQKPASIQPRTSLSKFGGKFNPFFIRHLAGNTTALKTRSRNVIRLWNKQIYANMIFADLFKIAKWCWGKGWAQRRAMPEDSNRKKSASIQPRAIPAEFSTASNFWPNFASIILRTSSAGTQFRSFERTQSSAKWYAVRYEVEDGRRERRRWWWRWGGCLYT